MRRPLRTVREVPGDVRVETVIKEKIVYRDREVPVQDEQVITNLQRAIQEQRARADAAESRLAEKGYEESEAPEPPEMVSELLREGHSMGDAANELARRWATFANLRQLNQELTPEQLAQEKRLQRALNWFQGDHSIEVV